MRYFRPNAIVFQLGTDSLAGDRLGCFNLTIKGHGECVEWVRSFGLPLILLGGGGYTLRNVSRCWAHETGVAVGQSLDNQIPFNEFFEYFAPNYTLQTLPTNMVNTNERAKLDEYLSNLLQKLKQIDCAPSVQIGNFSRKPFFFVFLFVLCLRLSLGCLFVKCQFVFCFQKNKD